MHPNKNYENKINWNMHLAHASVYEALGFTCVEVALY